MGTLGDLLGRLDPDPNRSGRQFERICQWFRTHNPVHAALLSRVWLWDEWPDRWGPDDGIDLVAEAKDGDLWAIQAKAYAATTSITKADVDSFLSASGRPQFAFRLLIATTDLVGPKATSTIRGQEKQAQVWAAPNSKGSTSNGLIPQTIYAPRNSRPVSPGRISAKR